MRRATGHYACTKERSNFVSSGVLSLIEWRPFMAHGERVVVKTVSATLVDRERRQTASRQQAHHADHTGAREGTGKGACHIVRHWATIVGIRPMH